MPLVLVAASIACSAAQTHPSWPVRLIVPFAPGGPTDVFARLVAQKMAEQTGKSFYVENVGGAGGNAGSGRPAQSAPDGYTLLVTGGSHLNNPFLYNHTPYDPMKDFEAVTLAVGIVALPDIKERLGALGYEFRTEMAKWSKVIKAAGIRAE